MSALSGNGPKLILGFVVTILVLIGGIGTLAVRDITQHAAEATAATVVYAPPAHTIATTSSPANTSHNATTTTALPPEIPQTIKPDETYIEVTDGCAAHFQGECLLVRSGPGKSFPVVLKLRNGVVLKVSETVETDGQTWYKIIFDEWLRYPERVPKSLYVAAEYVTLLHEPAVTDLVPGVTPSTTKRIIVDRSEQKLYAYDGDTLIMTATTSTGLDNTPTPRGVFTVYKKTPSRYMQGPLPNLNSAQAYDLPGVPWNLYFTEGGAVIHGAYWHNSFGTPYSHGCVNLSVADAKRVYDWTPVGTTVTVHD